jgi:hypothetical protein
MKKMTATQTVVLFLYLLHNRLHLLKVRYGKHAGAY